MSRQNDKCHGFFEEISDKGQMILHFLTDKMKASDWTGGKTVMKYVVLVSHGTFAQGLHSVLKMLAGGGRTDVLSAGMEDGMGADVFVERFRETVSPIGNEDEIILLADIIGGSPLTNALDVLAKAGMLERTRAYGGMNLPMALTAALMKDAVDWDTLEASMLMESKNAMARMELNTEEENEDDI